ncbi:MAG: OB-fold putative lipoprotein [Deltaproteobacteria bacterium]|jgi:tetratricopeptide (TPR) repeat protein|nr:OB-fold putative lipoprotein [Deltaproteobacteria bacterium]
MKSIIVALLFAAVFIPGESFAFTAENVAEKMNLLRMGSSSLKEVHDFCNNAIFSTDIPEAEKADLYACRSYTNFVAGEKEAAVKDADAALEADKNSYLGNLAQATILIASSNYGEASKFISAASKNAPTPELSEALKQRAILYQDVGILVSVQALVAAYNKDSTAADGVYGNKMLTIYGDVSEISVDDFGDPQVAIYANSSSKEGIVCGFSSKQQTELAQLVKGELAFISGKCGGSVPQIVLSKCSVQNF